MYTEGQRVVIREKDTEKMAIVEDVICDNGGQVLRVKELETGVSRVVNPVESTIVEQLED
jgi:hypothetical protein